MAQSGYIVLWMALISQMAGLSFGTEPVDVTPRAGDGMSDCIQLGSNEYKLAYFGWPFTLDCIDLAFKVDNYHYDNDEDYTDKNATVIIRDFYTGAEEFRKNDTLSELRNIEYLYVAADVTKDTPATYAIILQTSDRCQFKIIHINKTNAPDEPCGRVPPDKQYSHRAEFNGDVHRLSCDTGDDIGEPEFYGRDFDYTWYRNCTKVTDEQIVNGDLELYNAQFEDGADYVCTITYNGRTRVVVQHNLCVHYPSTSGELVLLKCNDYSAAVGSDVRMECTVDLGLGTANPFYFKADWLKKTSEDETEELCSNPTLLHSANSTNVTDGTCETSYTKVDRCYQYDPEDEQSPSDSVTLSMTIRNVQMSDFGEYIAVLHNLGIQTNTSLTLFRLENGLRKSAIAAISVCISFLFLIALLIVIGFWKRHDVQWYWKKHFGPFETEVYDYTAYLAYYYDTDEQKMSEKTRKLTENLVLNLGEAMTKFHGTTYDDQKEVSPHHYQADTLIHVLRECHRVIICLTAEYITDHWSLYTTYQALTDAIETGKKVIFVLAPGAQKAVEEIKDTEARQALLSALRRNITVKWTGKIPFGGKFCRRLEYALPKLPRPGYSKYLSTSSQAPLRHHANNNDPNSPTSSEGFENGFSSMVV